METKLKFPVWQYLTFEKAKYKPKKQRNHFKAVKL